MDDKDKPVDPQVPPDRKLGDDVLDEVSGGWGPVSNRFFDQLRDKSDPSATRPADPGKP